VAAQAVTEDDPTNGSYTTGQRDATTACCIELRRVRCLLRNSGHTQAFTSPGVAILGVLLSSDP
jgi:hypothetical protein